MKISSIASQKPSENDETEPILKISSIASEKSSDNDGGGLTLKISSFASEKQSGDDVVEIDDEDDNEPSSKEKENGDDTNSSKEKSDKPVLKLASFAEMSSNGISTSDLAASSIADDDEAEAPVTGECSLCDKSIRGYKSAVVWETMQFCDDKCLSEYRALRPQCKKIFAIQNLREIKFGNFSGLKKLQFRPF